MMTEQATKFQTFRAATAPTLEQSHVLRFEGVTPEIDQGLKQAVKAGIGEGSFAKILINVPGFSLAYAWHKSDYPLPLHSHDSDCCYLIIAGEMTVGNETLGKGDGMFVPANSAYTFFTGEEGVEFIEYRNVNSWNIVFKSKNPASWEKVAQKAGARREAWLTEPQPFGLVEPVACETPAF
jgi:mannose-6-phosphate isomerase-like protein (cupin superfamily)